MNDIRTTMKNQALTNYSIKWYINESLTSQYICNEIIHEYVQHLFISNNEIHELEQCDEQISKTYSYIIE